MIIGGYAPSLLNFRGALIEALMGAGHDVVACAPGASERDRNGLSHLGARYRDIPMARAGLNPLADLVTLRALSKAFDEECPDRVLAYTAKPVIYSCLASGRSAQHRVYAMITGLGYAFGQESLRQRTLGVLTRLLYKVALRRASGVLFQNPDDEALFVASGLLPSRTPRTVINGSGVDLVRYKREPLPIAPVFLLLARLLRDKGIREYAEAASLIKSRHPAARFLLAGDIDANPMSISAAEMHTWTANGSIEYLGRLEDVRPAIAASAVYVLPSYREGTPRTVLEAMAMGRPIITTDAPGCRETVVDGLNGFLVAVKNAQALAEAMEKFIKNPALIPRMGQESLRMAREKYDVHKVNKVILEAMGL
jgi:glycosyltransferase involved in cell wall biosynthesis